MSGITKSPLACDYCRLKKIRCTGQVPCRNCVSHGEVCHFTPTTRRAQRKPREAKEAERKLRDRLERAERLLRDAGITLPSIDNHNRSGETVPAALQPQHANTDCPLFNSSSSKENVANRQLSDTSSCALPSPFQPLPLTHGGGTSVGTGIKDARVSPDPHVTGVSSHRTTLQGSVNSPVAQRVSPASQSALEPKTTASSDDTLPLYSVQFSMHGDVPESPLEELHGPGSYLSICSNPAADWVFEQIGTSGFSESAASLTSTVYHDLKMQFPMHPGEMPEPDLACAMSYAAGAEPFQSRDLESALLIKPSTVYFEHAFESVFDIVDRTAFETRLTAQFSGLVSSTDPAWYALRNVVYAFGSRSSTYSETAPESWGDAQRQSWRYFGNALSVYNELAHFRSNLSTVQALLAMALFVEGFGHPKLEYMLISTAVRLAQSKGLHLQPTSAYKLSKSEKAHRSRLFWTMYAYEKHVAYRAGRPSMINDDHIDCHWPEPLADQPSIKMDFFHHVIRHAQISSAIVEQWTSIKARQRKCSQTIKNVNEIHQRLISWYDSVPETLRFRGPYSVLPSPHLKMAHLTYLHLAYHGSLAAIHSVFAVPWGMADGESDPNIDINPQIETSTQVLAEAARNIILTSKYLHISAAAPTWELFLYPIVGMINLFVYILKHPTRPSVASDLGLLRMGAGYFGYLEYATASLRSFPFTKDIVMLAQKAMERVQDSYKRGSEHLPASIVGLEANGNDPMDYYSWDEILDSNEMGVDNFVGFLPSLDRVASIQMDTFADDPVDYSIDP